MRSFPDVAQHLLSFVSEDLCLLGRRWVVRHLFFRQDGHGDVAVRTEALQEFIDAGRKVLLLDFSDGNEMVLDQLPLTSSSAESVCGVS